MRRYNPRSPRRKPSSSLHIRSVLWPVANGCRLRVCCARQSGCRKFACEAQEGAHNTRETESIHIIRYGRSRVWGPGTEEREGRRRGGGQEEQTKKKKYDNAVGTGCTKTGQRKTIVLVHTEGTGSEFGINGMNPRTQPVLCQQSRLVGHDRPSSDDNFQQAPMAPGPPLQPCTAPAHQLASSHLSVRSSACPAHLAAQ
ncbi:unnamed protein product [Pleuronectes platessa]|uniref:Uncharacterized protein n=1 Tax=Pleuronectes platessa TaxID=8262 RepID=A0A9N7VQM3_PLEPL|nr:unnamed protein product [Pleuronectes platessa]